MLLVLPVLLFFLSDYYSYALYEVLGLRNKGGYIRKCRPKVKKDVACLTRKCH